MKDFADNELEIGQKVVCLTAGRSTSWMIWGEVVGFTPKKVRIKTVKRYRTVTGVLVENVDEFLRDPDNVLLPMQPGYGPHAFAGDPGEDLSYSPED